MILSDVDGHLIVQNMATLVTGTLSSSRAFFDQIHCLVASARAIYSASQVEIAIDFCFLDANTSSNC
jgi:hypothetical protein